MPAMAVGFYDDFFVTYSLDGTVPAGPYTETHAVTGPGIGPNYPYDNTIQVNAATTVTPAFTHTTATLTPPAQVTTTIQINNTTGAALAAGAQYTISGLPAGADNATCSGTGCGTGTGAANITGGTLSMTLASIPVGNHTMTITYDLDATVTASYTEIHALDASSVANLASVAAQSNPITITAAALASLSWGTPPSGTNAPGTVTHTVTVNNSGGAAIPPGALYTISGLPA